MDRNQPRPALGAPRNKTEKGPNSANDLRRERERAAREGRLPVQQQPVQPMSLIPSFPNSTLLKDWTLVQGAIAPVYNQGPEETCASVALCHLLQAHYNRDKVVALQHQFSIKDLTNYMKTKTGKLSISNLNVALDYIVEKGLLKTNGGGGREARSQGYRVEGRFEVKRDYSREQVYAVLEESPLAISLEHTRIFSRIGVEEIYDVPIHRIEKDSETEPAHVVLVVARGVTIDGKDFLVVQNSWGIGWCNQGYARISLDPAGKFEVFWPTQSMKKK